MDWSALNIAGVLSQKQGRVERFIGCWGRKCNRYEKHYPSMKGELLALVKSIERWKHILKYQLPCLVYTDAYSLKYIVNIKSDESIFQHWFSDLAQFEFIVIHKKGIENVNCVIKIKPFKWTNKRKEWRVSGQEWSRRAKDHLCYRSRRRSAKERRRFAGYLPAVHSMSQETRHEIIEGNKLKKLQEADEVRREVIQWVLEGKASQMQELRGKVQKVLTVRQLFNPMR